MADKFDLTEGSYSILDIQDYFEYIIKKHETIADNPHMQIYTNKIVNRNLFKIKTSYKLKLLSSETMELLGSTRKDAVQGKDGEKVQKLEYAEVVLLHCSLFNNNYQQHLKYCLLLCLINNLVS